LEASSKNNEDHLKNENTNQGLINTIVNYNNKIKNVEHKMNFIVNNYANASQVKSKIMSLVHHDLTDLFIMVCMLLGILLKLVKKYIIPKITKYIRQQSLKFEIENRSMVK
jgi:hypothetical protein